MNQESSFNWNEVAPAVRNPFESATRLEEIISIVKDPETILPIDLMDSLSAEEKLDVRKTLITQISNFCNQAETDFDAAAFIKENGGSDLFEVVQEVTSKMDETPFN